MKDRKRMHDFLRQTFIVLKIIENARDDVEFDIDSISPKTLGISNTYWAIIFGELLRNGYIIRETIPFFIWPDAMKDVMTKKTERLNLTIKGAEFLQKNKTMRTFERWYLDGWLSIPHKTE